MILLLDCKVKRRLVRAVHLAKHSIQMITIPSRVKKKKNEKDERERVCVFDRIKYLIKYFTSFLA
jgi:hypothetical protein